MNLKEVSRVIVPYPKTTDTFLVGRRKNSGLWVILGGGIDPGETKKAAALRELYEESGRQATEITFLFEDAFGDWLTYYYLCTEISKPKRKPDKEHTRVDFIPLKKLNRKNMGQNHYDILQRVSEQLEQEKREKKKKK